MLLSDVHFTPPSNHKWPQISNIATRMTSTISMVSGATDCSERDLECSLLTLTPSSAAAAAAVSRRPRPVQLKAFGVCCATTAGATIDTSINSGRRDEASRSCERSCCRNSNKRGRRWPSFGLRRCPLQAIRRRAGKGHGGHVWAWRSWRTTSDSRSSRRRFQGSRNGRC